MTATTPNLGLIKATGSDKDGTYLKVSLAQTLDILDLLPSLTSTSTLTNKTLTAPHMTTPVVDSGGMTITAGGVTITAGNLGIGIAAQASYGVNLTGPVTVAGGQGVGIANSPTIAAAANNDTIYVELSQPALNATSKTGVTIYGKYTTLGAISNWGQANTSGYGHRIVAPTGAAVDNIGLWLSGTPSGGSRNLSLLTDAGVAIGSVAATTSTDGFVYVTRMGGTPTGVPTAVSGYVATVMDTAGLKLWAYIGGGWKSVTFA